MMYARLVHIIATLWLLPLQIAAATADDSMVNLVPVPRHHWDADALAVRDDTEAAVAPAGHERFIWSSKKGKQVSALRPGLLGGEKKKIIIIIITIMGQCRGNTFV